MEFRSTVKGSTAETLVRVLLQSTGCTVMATSVEQLIPSVVAVTQGRYAQMALPHSIRYMADLLVIPPAGAARLLEIKYRTFLDLSSIRWIREKASKQASFVSDVHTVLVRGVSPAGTKARLDDIVRVVPPGRVDLLTAGELAIQQPLTGVTESAKAEGFWQALQPLSELLPVLREHTAEVEVVVRAFIALARM
jgi:hypothetical protein